MKIGTKPYARWRRNELTEVTRRWTADAPVKRLDSSSDRTLDRTLAYSDQTL